MTSLERRFSAVENKCLGSVTASTTTPSSVSPIARWLEEDDFQSSFPAEPEMDKIPASRIDWKTLAYWSPLIQSWIFWASIGGVVSIILLTAGIFFILRQQRKKDAANFPLPPPPETPSETPTGNIQDRPLPTPPIEAQANPKKPLSFIRRPQPPPPELLI